MANWKNIMQKVGTALGLLTDKMRRLENQRDAARTTLQKARAALQTHLLDGDDGDERTVAALQGKIDSAQSLLTSLDEAIRTQTERVAVAERDAADKETKAKNMAASEVIANDVARIEGQLKPWLMATTLLASDLTKYGAARFECGSIGAYLANLAAETEVALAVSIPDLKGYAVAVAEGRERAPTTPATVVKLVTPKPQPTETIYFLKPAKWTDANGQLHLIQRTTDAMLTVALAKHAIKIGAAVERTDQQRKQTLGGWSGRPLRREDCVALDAASETSNVTPIMSSHFQTVDRGPPITGTMRQPGAMAATRTLPTKK
jgi:hypothetical protein